MSKRTNKTDELNTLTRKVELLTRAYKQQQREIAELQKQIKVCTSQLYNLEHTRR